MKTDNELIKTTDRPGVMRDAVIGDAFILRNGIKVLFIAHDYSYTSRFILTTLDVNETTISVDVYGKYIADKTIHDYDVMKRVSSYYYKPQLPDLSNRTMGDTVILRCGHTARLVGTTTENPPRYLVTLDDMNRTELSYPSTGYWIDRKYPHPLDIVKHLRFRPY